MSLATNQQPTAAPNRARGSSFYLAMRILPRAQREGMFEVYAFCKAVDDIADSDAPRDWRLARLKEWRGDIGALYDGKTPGHLANLAKTVKRFDLRKDDFLAVIEGMEMDAVEDIHAPSLASLDLYCDRVASAVGRLSVRVFGLADAEGLPLAHHLGRALQLTNILRDIDEDAGIGRLYLPHEALSRAGIESVDPQTVVRDSRLPAACEMVIARAREHFTQADMVMARSPRHLVRAPRIMERAYQKILDALVQRGWNYPRRRVHVSRAHFIGIALRYAFI